MKLLLKKLSVAVLLAFVALPSSAQNIGYQGRKTAFYYSAYLGYRAALNTEKTENKHLNLAHAFEFDYTYSQKSSIGFSLRLNPTTQYDLGDMNYTDILNHRYVLEFDPSVHPTIKTTMMGIYFKFRAGKQIAPIGNYQRLGIYMINAKADYNPAQTQLKENYTVKNYINSNKQPYINSDPWGNNNDLTLSTIGIGYGYGSQRVIENKYIINYGMEFVIPAVLPINELPELDNNNVEEAITEGIKMEMFRAVFFKVHIGIGILGPRSKARY